MKQGVYKNMTEKWGKNIIKQRATAESIIYYNK